MCTAWGAPPGGRPRAGLSSCSALARSLPAYVGETPEEYVVQEGGDVPPQPRMVTLYIGKGKKDKVSRGDVLGFLCKTGGLEGADIGRIDVMERWAYVAVDSGKWKDAVKRASGAKLKGIKTVVELL